MELIKQTLSALEKGREEIGEKRTHLLGLQNAIVALRGLINESANKVTAAEEERLSRLFSFEGPRIWDVSKGDAEQSWSRFREQMVSNFNSFRDYASTKMHWIFLSVLFLVIVTLMLRATRKRLEAGLEDHEALLGTKLLLEHPFASSIVIVIFINAVFHSEAPRSWHNVFLLIGIIALLRLLPAFVPSQLTPFAFLLLGLRTLELINAQIPEGTLLGRFLTVLIILFSLGTLFWFKNRIALVQDLSKKWAAFLHLASWTLILLLAIALLSGIFGNIALAGLLASGIVRTAFMAVSSWLAFSVFRGMLILSLRTQFAQKSRLIRNNRDLIFQKITRIVGALIVVVFTIAVPDVFSVFDPIASVVVETVTKPLEFRSLSISLADVIAFLFLVWLSFQVSRLICFILEEDFLPRLRLPRGVPAAVSHLTYYAILFLGFLIALTAAGFDLGSLTILASAFGVGIGFGLQNIVNNFVSGLILLFERPVRVGDKIQLAQDLTGEVLRIGIRASVVRTLEGAEVLVPNGHLISNELTNWTLSDRKRRMTILIGVAYGTDPQKVLNVLRELAAAHPEVLSDPEPSAFFLGFGESSLDFSLLVWVDQFEKGFQVRSDLGVAINAALKEAGIEIPFPQRDLHLRSVTDNFKLQDGNQLADGDR
jgi:small-conductance mechanosensitive channel